MSEPVILNDAAKNVERESGSEVREMHSQVTSNCQYFFEARLPRLGFLMTYDL